MAVSAPDRPTLVVSLLYMVPEWASRAGPTLPGSSNGDDEAACAITRPLKRRSLRSAPRPRLRWPTSTRGKAACCCGPAKEGRPTRPFAAHNECTFYTFCSTPRVGGGGGRRCMKMSFVHSQFSFSPTGLQENECGPYCRPSWCRPWCSETCPTSSGCPRPIAVRVQSALGSGRRRKDDGIGRRKEEEGEGVGRRGEVGGRRAAGGGGRRWREQGGKGGRGRETRDHPFSDLLFFLLPLFRIPSLTAWVLGKP